MIRKGYIDNPEQLVTLRKVTVSEGRAYRPREEMHREYMKVYERYKAVYPAVCPLMQGGETNAG